MSKVIFNPPVRFLYMILAALAGLEIASLKESHPVKATPIGFVIFVFCMVCFTVLGGSTGYVWEVPVLVVGLLVHQILFATLRASRWAKIQKELPERL